MIEVTISDRALQSMVLAACEAYAFGKNNKRKPVETYAHLWGYRRRQQESETEYLHVDRISICVSAKVSNSQTVVSTDVIALQDDIVKHWSPHLSLLGDFHTHPYRTRAKLRKNKGWEFSDVDKGSFRDDDNLWNRAEESPISLVMAIAELRRVREGWANDQTAYRWRFDVGQYRFYISAAAGRRDNNGERQFYQKGVNLFLGQYFYNRAGNRVGED